MQEPQQKQEIKAIFVFGTLKPGHDYAYWNRLVIDHKEKEAKFYPKMRHAILRDYQVYFSRYPLLKQEKGCYTNGFVLEVRDEIWEEFLKQCDEIEDYPHMYDRVLMDVEVFQEYSSDKNKEQQQVIVDELGGKKGEVQNAWVYMCNEQYIDYQKLVKIGNDFRVEHFEKYSNKVDFEKEQFQEQQ